MVEEKKPDPEISGSAFKQLLARIARLRKWTGNFFRNDLWLIDIRTLKSRGLRTWLNFLRIVRMVANVDGFSQISKDAQSLSYSAALSVIPMLTVVFWFTSGTLWRYVRQLFGQLIPDVTVTDLLQLSGITLPPAILDSVNSMVSNLSGISIFSIIILVISLAWLFMGIEDNINDVYGIKRSRSYPKRLLVWSAMVVGTPIMPALIMVFPGRHLIGNMWSRMRPGLENVRVSLRQALVDLAQQQSAGREAGRADNLQDSLTLYSGVLEQLKQPLREGLLNTDTFIFALLVLLSISTMFAILYKALPYTRVNLKAACLAALVASLFWFIWDLIFVVYIMWPGTTSKIYGSLAVIPFFFLWLYVSWVIFLYGAKICYALQYRLDYDPAVENGCYTTMQLERVACRIFYMLVSRWRELEAEQPGQDMSTTVLYSIEELVPLLHVPLRVIEQTVSALEKKHIVKVLDRENVRRPTWLCLSCNIDEITIHDLQEALRGDDGQRQLPLSCAEEAAGDIQGQLDQLLDEGRRLEAEYQTKVKFTDLIT